MKFVVILVLVLSLFIIGCNSSPSPNEIEEYRQHMLGITMQMKTSLEGISTIASKDLEYWSEDDMTMMYTNFHMLEGLENQVDDIDPPKGYEDLHEIFREACVNYGLSGKFATEGLTTLSGPTLQLSIEYMEKGNELMIEAMNELDKLNNEQ